MQERFIDLQLEKDSKTKLTLIRAGKIRFSGTRKSVLLKASSRERCAPRKCFALCDVRRYTCSPDCVLCRAPNEID